MSAMPKTFVREMDFYLRPHILFFNRVCSNYVTYKFLNVLFDYSEVYLIKNNVKNWLRLAFIASTVLQMHRKPLCFTVVYKAKLFFLQKDSLIKQFIIKFHENECFFHKKKHFNLFYNRALFITIPKGKFPDRKLHL